MILESVSFLDAVGTPIAVACVTINGVKVPVHMAEVRLAELVPWSGAVTAVAPALLLDIPANAARKGGEIRAPLANTGLIVLTIKKTDGTSFVKTLEPGSAYPLSINPGFVLPHEIEIRGTVLSDTWEGVEYI